MARIDHASPRSPDWRGRRPAPAGPRGVPSGRRPRPIEVRTDFRATSARVRGSPPRIARDGRRLPRCLAGPPRRAGPAPRPRRSFAPGLRAPASTLRAARRTGRRGRAARPRRYPGCTPAGEGGPVAARVFGHDPISSFRTPRRRAHPYVPSGALADQRSARIGGPKRRSATETPMAKAQCSTPWRVDAMKASCARPTPGAQTDAERAANGGTGEPRRSIGSRRQRQEWAAIVGASGCSGRCCMSQV